MNTIKDINPKHKKPNMKNMKGETAYGFTTYQSAAHHLLEVGRKRCRSSLEEGERGRIFPKRVDVASPPRQKLLLERPAESEQPPLGVTELIPKREGRDFAGQVLLIEAFQSLAENTLNKS